MSPERLASALDTIRRAAGVLYQRLEVTTGGTWRDAGGYGEVVSDEEPHDDGYGGRLVGESMRPGDREYLVTVQPAVTRQVADWLASCAGLYAEADAGPLLGVPLAYAESIASAVLAASRDAMPGDPLDHLPQWPADAR
jgi:hypothetical protein